MPILTNPDDELNRAAEQILDDPGLRDELTDDEAQPLIDWGLAQVKLLARNASARAQPAPLDVELKHLRRLMKRINRFVGLRALDDPAALATELERLTVVSRKLYGERPGLLPDEASRAVLVDEMAGMSNSAVVLKLLALLGPEETAAQFSTAQEDAAPSLLPRHEPPPALAQPPQPDQLAAPPQTDRLTAPPEKERLAAPPERERLAPPPQPGVLPPLPDSDPVTDQMPEPPDSDFDPSSLEGNNSAR